LESRATNRCRGQPSSLEGLGLAEEAGDVDQEVVVEGVHLARVLLEVFEVAVHLHEAVEEHAPLEAALDGAGLVVAEVHPSGGAQAREDRLELLLGGRELLARAPRLAVAEEGMATEARELMGELRQGEHPIHRPSGHGRPGHAVVLGALRGLGEGEAALRLDLAKPIRSVRGGAGRGTNRAGGAVVSWPSYPDAGRFGATVGSMFGLRRKRFIGSYLFFRATRRL
jgi:hypothetical protein